MSGDSRLKKPDSNQSRSVGAEKCWHSYRLQGLIPSRFADIVGKILRRQHALIVPERKK
jgi:hypothetical protein